MQNQTDLSTALQIVRRRGWLAFVSVLFALAAAYGVTRLIPPTYEATATLFVGANVPRAQDGLDLQYASLAQSLVTSYAELAETRAVAEEAARGADLAPDQVVGHVETESQPGLQILKLRARAASAPLAATVANAVAEALSDRVSTLNGPASRRIGVEVVDAATPPGGPASPRLFLNLVFGGLVGLLSGVGLALARERLDTRIRTPEQAERELGLPVLGVVPKLGRRIRRSEALARHAHPEVAEPYRSIAVALVGGAGRGQRQGRILVTSARPKEGKTSVAAHLALALAEDNRRIALIEGDLRRPSLRQHFPADEAPELSDVLYRTVDWRLPPSSGVCPGLDVLTAGESHTDIGLILRAPEFERTLEGAVRDHDHVLVDAPPTLVVSDAGVLARHADAVVIVVRAASTRAEDVHAVQAAFRRLGVEVAGVVLVGGTREPRRRYDYGGVPSGLSHVKPLHEFKPLSEVSEK